MTRDQLALLEDTRLSRAARLMGLWLSTRDDWTEVSRDAWQRFLGRGARGMATKEAVASYLGELEVGGWVERRRGGRGHSDSFAFKGMLEADPKKDSVGSSPTPTALASGIALPHRAPATTTDGYDGYDYSPDAEKVVDGELFKGCRGALRDYLRLRVRTHLQHGYAQRLAQALNGSDGSWWKDRTGGSLPEEGRTGVLAMALNELASGDEIGEHYRSKPGSIGNLRTKVRHEVGTMMGQNRDAKEGTHGRAGPQDQGGDTRGGGSKAGGAGRASRRGEYRHG